MNDIVVHEGSITFAPELIAEVTETEKLEVLMQEIKNRIQERDERVMEGMKANGLQQVTIGKTTFTIVAEHTRNTFNSTQFKKDDPETWQKYLRVSTIKESLRKETAE